MKIVHLYETGPFYTIPNFIYAYSPLKNPVFMRASANSTFSYTPSRNLITPYSSMKSTPSVLGPQWEEMVQPATA